ncbi:MAG: sulfate adenylyltransferase subunit 1 [Flavobacteriaceae bacterium]
MELLRIVTAGSVDDGKSTLIGRLLYETNSLKDDQLDHIIQKSKSKGIDYIDFSLATDGLLTEREQGITIDVSNIFFKTTKRRFIIADAPGHVEYTRNMVTGASNADVAIILIDARKGVLEQTQRHYKIIQLLGISTLIFVINKMDLIDYEYAKYQEIQDSIHRLTEREENKIHILPISALKGDNITTRSQKTDWYRGDALLDLIEKINLKTPQKEENILQVQWVIRPQLNDHHDYRGFAGKVNSGQFQVGEEVTVFPSGLKSKIKQIERYGTAVNVLHQGENGTLILEDEIDLSRGSTLLVASAKDTVEKTKQIRATLCWMQNEPCNLQGKYILQQGIQQVQTKIVPAEGDTSSFVLNAIGSTSFRLSEPILGIAYKKNKQIGRFILIDQITNNTAAVGFIL